MTHPCPKCNRTLIQQGQVLFKGVAYRFYICDECIGTFIENGVEIEVSLGFGVAPDGTIINPHKIDKTTDDTSRE